MADIEKEEKEILEFWEKDKTFEKSLERTKNGKPYIFYDGPPFATGLPHYGHLLASILKDVFPRFFTMNGRLVKRNWGWDCHGLPVENVAEKDLGLKSKDEIEKMGVKKFNDFCRSKVLTYAKEWEKTINRIGRWVDFENGYKTMDTRYIESIWWAFKELYDKGYMYEGEKILMYCPHCSTPLAKSEIAMDNSYKLVKDLSVVVKFKLDREKDAYVLSWTTTPWTLPSNLALTVNPNLDYAFVEDKTDGNTYVLAKDLVKDFYKSENDYTVKKVVKGKELEGQTYEPLYPYFKDTKNAFKIILGDFVTEEDGTGIVHTAPAFGEDDNLVCRKYKIPMVQPVDEKGCFTNEVTDYAGEYIHEINEKIVIDLKKSGKAILSRKVEHEYPFCYRCDTKLMYRALPAWFVDIDKIRKRLQELNLNINWIPEFLKEGRMKNNIALAPDWNITRNRYWASAIPIWKSEYGKIKVIGSIEELKKYAKNLPEREIYLMRHGESENNKKEIIRADAKSDTYSLTKKGQEQAKSSGEKLVGKIDLIISSDFLRTKETAEIISKVTGANLIFDSRLRDLQSPKFEGLTLSEFRKVFPKKSKIIHEAPDGMETLHSAGERVKEAIEESLVKFPGKRILFVSHADPIMTYLWMESGEDDRAIDSAHYPDNAEVIKTSAMKVDLHKDYLDPIKLEINGEEYTRIPEVLDCWFESGGMTFAQFHYPFENKEFFEKNFPADFVVEYIGQTRAWFYYMIVLSAILFDKIPFQNVLTTGTILAEDGQKMSKSKKNFPDPEIVLKKYGADALRFYLLQSSVMNADNFNFSEKGLEETYKKLILLLYNVNNFYSVNARKTDEKYVASKNVMDKWIVSRLNTLTKNVKENLENYNTIKASSEIINFVDDLSTWYVRNSRDRFNEDDKDAGKTLRFVLDGISKVIAPIIPFAAEKIHQTIHGKRSSVHLQDWPGYDEKKIDSGLEEKMKLVREIVSIGLRQRDQNNVPLKWPLNKVVISYNKPFLHDEKELQEIIKQELNVKNVDILSSGNEGVNVELDLNITPELEAEGYARELSRNVQAFRKKLGLVKKDVIELEIISDKSFQKIIENQKNLIKSRTNAKKIVFADAILSSKGENQDFKIKNFAGKIKIVRLSGSN